MITNCFPKVAEMASVWPCRMKSITKFDRPLQTYGSYRVARQWYKVQRQLRDMARGLARPAGQASLACEWRD